jgi:hypothetical protein
MEELTENEREIRLGEWLFQCFRCALSSFSFATIASLEPSKEYLYHDWRQEHRSGSKVSSCFFLGPILYSLRFVLRVATIAPSSKHKTSSFERLIFNNLTEEGAEAERKNDSLF